MPLTPVVCVQCGTTFYVKPCYLRRPNPSRFCSKRCFYAGRVNPGMTGKTHSEETKAKWKGHLPGITGKEHSKEARAKMSATKLANARAEGREPWSKERAKEWKRTYYREYTKKPKFVAWRREWQRKQRETEAGALINNFRSLLRATLRKVAKGDPPGGAFKLLPYTREEFVAHVQSQLEVCGYLCPMCSKSLRDGYDIDHIWPLHTARSVEDVLALFALSNMRPTCATCNRFVKRGAIPATCVT